MQQAKQLVADLSNTPIDQAQIDKTCELIANIRVSAEGQEGLKAFLEKRPASWRSDTDNKG
jgi:methylglutaconyl-CoA hydratase